MASPSLAMGAAALWLSDRLSDALAAYLGIPVPSILVLTTLALVLAQSRLCSACRAPTSSAGPR